MFSGLVTTLVNGIALAVAYPVYLHFLGYEKYGLWLVLSVVLMFAQLGDLGVGAAVMKLVAEEYGRGNIEGVQGYITAAVAILGATGLVVIIGLLVFRTQIVALFKLSPQNAKTALWLLPYVGVLSVGVYIVRAINAAVSGLGRMDLANYILSAGKIIAVGVSSILLWLGKGIESLLIGNTLSYIFVGCASLFVIRKKANVRPLRLGCLNVQCCKRVLRFGSGVFGGSLVSMLLSPFNKLMLSRYAGVSSVPVYEIAFNGSMQVRSLFEAGLRSLMPEISRLNGIATKYAWDRIIQIYRHAMRLILFVGVPIYVTLIVFSPLLLRVWLGDRYVEVLLPAFRIMLLGTFIMLLGVPAYYTIMGLGKVRYIMKMSLMSSFGDVFLVFAYYVIRGRVSVQSVCLCFTLSLLFPLGYLLCKNSQLLAMSNNSCEMLNLCKPSSKCEVQHNRLQ